MQLIKYTFTKKPNLKILKLSMITSYILASSLLSDDYVNVQFMGYDEDSGRTNIYTPSIEINKDFGADYTLNLSYVYDSVSGASPIFYDSSSGASPSSKGLTKQENVKYGDVDYKEGRNAGGISLIKRFENRDELTAGVNISRENDYYSNELSTEYLHWIDASKNQAFTFGASYQKNKILIECALGNDECDSSSGASQTMNLDVMSAELGFTQVIDKTSLIKASFFYINEDGYLSNPYMRIVRNFNTNPNITQDKKPDSRKAYGATLEYSKALNDKISTTSTYRYYSDDWDITSHTIGSEVYYEFDEKLTTGLGIRYYKQSEADFYNGAKEYFTEQTYASSDRRVSNFDSLNYKLSADYKINSKISINTNINLYEQADYFDAFYYNIGAKYKF